MVRRIRLVSLALPAVLYFAWLWWLHHLVRSPFNLDYFTHYVSIRCSAQQTDHLERPASREALQELAKASQRCQSIKVAVDGVWGGIRAKPAVRLKVLFAGETTPEFRYYSVDVDPILGTASIRYDLSPALYYWNP
jgi:hypothetical protein